MTQIIDIIRAEIERRKGYISVTHFAEEILSIIDSLQQKEPEVDDIFKKWGTTEEEYLANSMEKVHLEMEISTYLKDWEDDEEIGLHLSTDNGCITIELDDIRDLARHFYELGLNARK